MLETTTRLGTPIILLLKIDELLVQVFLIGFTRPDAELR